jgi:hypothetical protein
LEYDSTTYQQSVAASSKLTDDDILMVLTRHDLTARQCAEALEVSMSCVQRIRRNESFAYVHPHIPRDHKRTAGPRCDDCVHLFRGACTLGFPEHREAGPYAAVYCNAFTRERIL